MTMILKDVRVATPRVPAVESVSPPGWVWGIVGGTGAAEEPLGRSGEPRESRGNGCVLLSARVANVTSLHALEFQHAVCSLYESLTARLNASACPHAVRLWNFIPRIHTRMGTRDGGILDRYMVFNAGRFAAYMRWYGESGAGPRSATATGIGHSGDDLVVHCLAAGAPGVAVENPRQVPAYRYSTKRGPLPPCFARATRTTLNDERVLLVGGTSSVRGESSVHPGDLDAQVGETLTNMAALVLGKSEITDREESRALECYRSLRVYCVHGTDLSRVARTVEARFRGLEAVEYVRADVCRRTLLVEIEGVARCV